MTKIFSMASRGHFEHLAPVNSVGVLQFRFDSFNIQLCMALLDAYYCAAPTLAIRSRPTVFKYTGALICPSDRALASERLVAVMSDSS